MTSAEPNPLPGELPPTVHSDPRAGGILVGIARAAIAAEFGTPGAVDICPAWLGEPGAVFVTLTRDGELRGCIGSLEARRPLAEDVASNARAAAFRDWRFDKLTARELDGLEIEVSLLSPTEPLAFTSESDALTQLRPGIDGLLLTWRSHRGTFLPQVWESLPDPAEFLARLKRKAGLPGTFWDPDVKLRRFTVTSWTESELPLARHP